MCVVHYNYYCIRKMLLIKKLFCKIRSKCTEKNGAALLEFAFIIPIAMLLLYMIIDIYQLFRIKGQINNMSLSAAQNTISVVERHKRATKNDLKEVAETAIMSFQGNLSKQDYNLYIAWEMIKNDGSSTSVMWSGYCEKAGMQDVSIVVGAMPVSTSDYESSDVWAKKLQELSDVNGIKSTRSILTSNPGKIHVNSNQYALVITVLFSQSKEDGWYNVSNMTYNVMKKTFGGNFSSQSFVIMRDDYTFPVLSST